VISSSQRPLPDNTQHSQQTNIHVSGGIRTQISAGERPQTYDLDRAATGISIIKSEKTIIKLTINTKFIKLSSHYTRIVEVYTEFWWGNLRERDHLEDPGVDGRKILR